VQNLDHQVHELQTQISNRHGEAKATKTSPSDFLHSVFERLLPLTKLIADVGDVTNTEMASKEQNQTLNVLLEPVMASFKESERLSEDVDGKLSKLLEQVSVAVVNETSQ
jgi:hypothetical protein